MCSSSNGRTKGDERARRRKRGKVWKIYRATLWKSHLILLISTFATYKRVFRIGYRVAFPYLAFRRHNDRNRRNTGVRPQVGHLMPPIRAISRQTVLDSIRFRLCAHGLQSNYCHLSWPANKETAFSTSLTIRNLFPIGDRTEITGPTWVLIKMSNGWCFFDVAAVEARQAKSTTSAEIRRICVNHNYREGKRKKNREKEREVRERER